MVYRKYRNTVTQYEFYKTKIKPKKCKYPMNLTFKGKNPIQQKRICFSALIFVKVISKYNQVKL